MGANLLLAVNREHVGKLTNDTPLAVWRRVNDGFENAELEPGDIIEHALEYHPFCAPHAHVRHVVGRWPDGSPKLSTYRHHYNWMPTNLAALDIDNTASGMEEFVDRNRGIVTFAYETTSHTPASPRYRVGIQLGKVIRNVDAYRLVLSALNYRFRGSGADISANDVVKNYSGTKSTAGVVVAPSAIADGDYIAAVVAEYRRYKEEAAAAKKEYQAAYGVVEADEIARMLEYMPVRQDYMDWCKTIWSVLDMCDPQTTERLIEEWSPGRPGEVALKIRSVQSGTKISIGWLISVAKRHGWKPAPASEESRIMRRMAFGNQRKRN